MYLPTIIIYRHRPIEEAKKYLTNLGPYQRFPRSFEEDHQSRIRILENEYHTFMAIGEALQAYYNGIKTLHKAESMIVDHEKTNQLFAALDFFRRAMVLVEEKDAEVTAMALTKIGIIFYQHLGFTIRAKDYFKEAMELATVLTGNKYTNQWYIELISTMRKIQEAAKKAEDEKWENKRKPFMEELEKDGTIAKLWVGKAYSIKGLFSKNIKYCNECILILS